MKDMSSKDFMAARKAAVKKVKPQKGIVRTAHYIDGSVKKTTLTLQPRKTKPGKMSKEELAFWKQSRMVNLGSFDPNNPDSYKTIHDHPVLMQNAMNKVKGTIAARGGKGTSVTVDNFNKQSEERRKACLQSVIACPPEMQMLIKSKIK